VKLERLRLTQRQIDGDEPAYAAWELVLNYVHGSRKKDDTALIRGLPRHWRAVYTTIALEGEVQNGGHHQFFWNGEGALNDETLEDLELIRAKPFVRLFREALEIYTTHDCSGEKRRSRNSHKAFTAGYREKRMDHLDQAFYKSRKTVAEYLSSYIRNHRELYAKMQSLPSPDSTTPRAGRRRPTRL